MSEIDELAGRRDRAAIMAATQQLGSFVRQAGEFSARYQVVHSTGTVDKPLELRKWAPIAKTPLRAHDPRPSAPGRDPCPRCGTRGEFGCAHFAPCEQRRP